MADTLTLSALQEAVAGTAAAFRSRITLQPAGGEGTKVFPPTYAGAVYATEKRRISKNGSGSETEVVECVLLDSVQSQANRMEEALQQAIDSGRFEKAGVAVPLIEVDFTPFFPGNDKSEDMRLLDPVGKVSSLQAPHRIADAILRDSLLNGQPFRQSEIGKRISMVSARDATALFEFCPTALIFGMWDSTGPKGGLGAKFERAMVSEIVGINAIYGVKTSSRIDPLGIQKNAGPLFLRRKDATPEPEWTLNPKEAEKDAKGQAIKFERGGSSKQSKPGDPSKANHSNYPPTIDDGGGVTIDRAEQTVVLSLPALRRLRFPINGKCDPKIDDAARTVLAALGLCAAALAAENGLDLRSRCLLWPTEPLSWELLGKPGASPTNVTFDADAAIGMLKDAVEQAKAIGLPWRDEPLVLTPSDELVKLVVKSQQLAVQQGGDSGGGDE